MSNSLEVWFKDRSLWLQEAAKRLIQSNALTEQDIDDLVKLCIKEASGETEDPGFTFSTSFFDGGVSDSLRLCSMSEVEGINLLCPRKPLDFGSENLVVIFGSNASGKSGYVRILKHACGARHPGTLISNIFSDDKPEQKCKITYIKGDEQKTPVWTATMGIVDDLRNVDIYDESCGLVYLEEENEVTYEPPVLSFFSDLVAICDLVSSEIRSNIQALVSRLPSLSLELKDTVTGKWYKSLSYITSDVEVAEKCAWDENSVKKLSELQQRLSEESPATKAQNIRSQKRNLDTIVKNFESYLIVLSDKTYENIIKLKSEAATKIKTADVAAKTLFEKTPLPGIGSEVWVALWEQARKYSEEKAYPEQEFPVTDEEARCALCQQELSTEAKRRMISFESFVKGAMSEEAEKAKLALDNATKKTDILPSTDNLKTSMDAAGLDDEEAMIFEEILADIRKRKEEIPSTNKVEDLTDLPNTTEIITDARSKSKELESSAAKYDEDAKGENREELTAAKSELEANKWMSEQKNAIEKEISRLKSIASLELALRLADTTALSRKKGDLAEELITDAFAKRFSSELNKLRASNVKIKIVKTRVKKGHALHCLRWQDAEANPVEDVLSEGENRIVSLSAFLADVAEKQNPGPFVFDDPISSLDQDFEESVTQRIVALSENRQVIVFTHRLSLLGLLLEYGKKAGREPHVVCIKRESWGAGEPGETPIFGNKPYKALNKLLDERLPQARKVLDTEGKDRYYPLAKAICSDFRIIIERIIEYDLLADVVQRFRRSVNTTGKLDKLAKITEADCKLLDELMTKFSRYEHSQPGEAPVESPLPDELLADMKLLREWRNEFDKRDI